MEKREIQSVFVDGKPLSKEAIRFINSYMLGNYSDVADIRQALLHISSIFLRQLPDDSDSYDVNSVRRFGRACENITLFADDLEHILDEENVQRRMKELIH